MSYEYLCKGCFAKMGASGQCPFCGFEEEKYVVPPHSLLPGVILNSRYIIGKVLGSGGFGITYIAFDMKLESIMAIKEYLPKGMAQRASDNISVSLHSEDYKKEFQHYMDSFLDEARILAKFNDELGIVSVQDILRENGTVYIVMYYVNGVTFEEYLTKNQNRLPYPKVMQIMSSIMESLKKIHAEGVIHRDISPDNIYLTPDNKVKLLDFGAARYFIGDDRSTVSVILKKGYAPIEQYQNKKENQGPWTDIYSLSATIYRALTGTKPPDALERLDVDILKSPGELGIELPDHIESAVMRGLNLKYNNRPKTLDDFMRLLEPVGRTEIITDPKIPYEERKQVRKKVTVPVLIALAAMMLAVSILLFSGKPGSGNVSNLMQGNILASNSGEGVASANHGAMVAIEPSEAPASQIPENSGSAPANSLEATAKPPESQAADTPAPTEATPEPATSGRQSEAVSEPAIPGKQSEAASEPASEPGIEEKPQPNPSATLKTPQRMPDLVNGTKNNSVLLLKSSNLEYKVESAYSDLVPAGNIISQSIPAGENVVSGDVVVITVSMGKKIVYPTMAQLNDLEITEGIAADARKIGGYTKLTISMYKDKLPSRLPESFNVCLCAADALTEESIFDLTGHKADMNVTWKYDGGSGEYYTCSEDREYIILLFLDADMNFLGYFIYRNPLAGNPEESQPAPTTQHAVRITNGIMIETEPTTLDHTLYMYKDMLPAGLTGLMKVIVCNTDDVSEAAILDNVGIYMRDRNFSFTFDGKSGDYYHWSDSGTKYEVVFLFDMDMNFVGYFVYQNPLKGTPTDDGQ